MNTITNSVFVVGDELTHKTDLKEPSFSYSACGPFTKNKQRTKKFKKKKGDSRQIYLNKLNKACFKHDTTCGKIKICLG